MIKSALLCFLLYSAAVSQTFIEQNLGPWSGQLSNINSFTFSIFLHEETPGIFSVSIKGSETNITKPLHFNSKQNIYSANINDYLYLKVRFENDSKNPNMFVLNGQHLSHIDLSKISQNKWQGSWNLFLVRNFDPTFYLSLEKTGDGHHAAYGFYRAPQNQNMYCHNFSYSGRYFYFEDKNSGIKFSGTLINKDNIQLLFKFLDDSIEVDLKRFDYEKWEIGSGGSGSEPLSYTGKNIESKKDLLSIPLCEAKLDGHTLDQLKKDVVDGKLPNTHSVLIARNNKLVFEEYFLGFDYDVPHDTRSASKSIASAAIGIAIDQKYIKSANEPVETFFDEYPRDSSWISNKVPITIFHLLTMSSGLDIIDGGNVGNSYASEWVYQKEKNWTSHILKAPIVYETGSGSYYGSGNPHLLGEILKIATNQPIEYYLYENFIKHLGWAGYRIQTDNFGLPYFGGGWYLTSRDLLKFGLLFLNKGSLNNKQIISADWISQAMANHNILKNRDDIGYGYLWWHRDYQKAEKNISSIEARGNGGQYIFIIPEYNMVVVITSGNYRERKLLKQPEWIMEKYIIKAIKD